MNKHLLFLLILELCILFIVTYGLFRKKQISANANTVKTIFIDWYIEQYIDKVAYGILVFCVLITTLVLFF